MSDDLKEAINQSFIYHESHGDDFRSDKQIETAYKYGFETDAKWADKHSFEMKEMDLEKEINKYISDNFFGSETMGFFTNRTKGEPDDQDIALCAKHFFELGMSVSNKAQKGE